jgi:hypothetical protein
VHWLIFLFVPRILLDEGKYLATLETSGGEESGGAKSCIRVYASWDDSQEPHLADGGVSSASSYDGPGTRSPSRSRSHTPELEVIELPRSAVESVAAFSCCPRTGNIVAAYKTHLALYKMKRLWDQAAGGVLLDFLLLLNIVPGFAPSKVVLRENVVACMSASFVHVFQVSFANKRTEQPEVAELSKGTRGHDDSCEGADDLKHLS